MLMKIDDPNVVAEIDRDVTTLNNCFWESPLTIRSWDR
jgi:hypothetical protein